MINYDYIKHIKYLDYNCIKGFQYEKYVLKKFNVDPKQSYFIGDSGFDIETARNTNMNSIGVLWGLSDEAKLSKFSPNLLFGKQIELLSFLKTLIIKS